MSREPFNRTLVVKFDYHFNMPEPIVIVENEDGDLLSEVRGEDRVLDLYDYLMGEEEY